MNQDELQAYATAVSDKVGELLLAHPDLHPITAHIVASDLLSAERLSGEVKAGLIDVERAVWLVGSYARWGWAMGMVQAGQLSEDWLAANLCHLWSISDPDDTDPANLAVFRRMYARHGGILRDGRPLPKGSSTRGYVRVYRGGMPSDVRMGFAWTTDPKVAQKFAAGAGSRVATPGGVVISGRVRSSHVLAYITGRSESEVIVDPRYVIDVEVTP